VEDKAENKRQLQIAMGLKVNDKVPLFAVVSRLTSQKGLDLVLEALPGLLEQGGQLALLGAGDPVLQEGFRGGGTPGAGGRADWLSRGVFAPHYGRRRRHSGAEPFRTLRPDAALRPEIRHLPLVRRTGGLADTVSDSSLENLADGIASGFVFEDSNAWSLFGRFGVLSYCGPVLLYGVTFNVRRWPWILAGTLRRSHTAIFINA
jgi:starch synthase